MYCPSHFQEERPEIIRDLILRFPLATIIYQRENELDAEHIPLIFDSGVSVHDAGRGFRLVPLRRWMDLTSCQAACEARFSVCGGRPVAANSRPYLLAPLRGKYARPQDGEPSIRPVATLQAWLFPSPYA